MRKRKIAAEDDTKVSGVGTPTMAVPFMRGKAGMLTFGVKTTRRWLVPIRSTLGHVGWVYELYFDLVNFSVK